MGDVFHFKKCIDIAYVTLNGNIPSTTANSVGVMSMCGELSRQGLRTLLLIPAGQGVSLSRLGYSSGDIFSYYSVPSLFEIKRFPNAINGKLSGKFRGAYSFFLVLYLLYRRVSLITTRNVEVAVCAAKMNLPVILESHNFTRLQNHPKIQSWVGFTNNYSKKVSMIVTTSAGKNAYQGIGVPGDRIRVFPNGVNIERFNTPKTKHELRQQLNLPRSKIIAAFSGSIGVGRGCEEMLDCAEILPEVEFIILGGSPDDVKKYKNSANSRGLQNVKFIGHVDQGTLSNYLLASDVLLMPYTTRFNEHTFEYTSPMKMFEYLATGVPIVATDFPVLHEALRHKQNAIFVKPDSGKELADGIRYFVENPDIANKIGKTAKNDSKKYAWSERAKKIIAWQREIKHLV